ncbi:WXG100 family type VII secretion target [Kitasatospora sp. NBC_01539]|uniref:WXG100 family type VII secretion target n=1 Tax=Kitasatospora sp. NBC_01539 TaxID=2903577 RepID=UPI00386020AE
MGLWDDVKDLGSAAVHVAEDVFWAPTKIAHWVLTKMFGDPDAELERYAAELHQMSTEVEAFGKEIDTALGHLTWHGAAADAFIEHARKRIKELNTVADELDDLGSAIKGLADAF